MKSKTHSGNAIFFRIGSSGQSDQLSSTTFHSLTHPAREFAIAFPSTVIMSQNTALRAIRSANSSLRSFCRFQQPTRCLSQTTFTSAQPDQKQTANVNKFDSIMSNVDASYRSAGADYFANLIPGQSGPLRNLTPKEWEEDDKHKFHIYATKHNTHITLSKPNRDALISVSCGNIGFRKAGRGSYDAAYQLAAFVMSRIQDKGLLPEIKKLELVYRGFGPGREAVTKAILGAEGKRIRPLIVKLSDSTRLKFGGVRSKKPRRLG
jgi:small subunit ribosomal protein S11